MSKDTRVKERGKAGCLHSCPLRKVGTGKDEHKLQQWDGTVQETTTPTLVSAVISPQYYHEASKDVGIPCTLR